MKQIRYLAASLFLLFISAVPAAASEPENAGWAPAYEQYILNGEYLTSEEPSYYTEDAEPVRFGLYDLDKDGFPELVAYNGCPFMAGACNYLFTYKNGQFSYIGDAGFRGSDLQYYPTGNYPGLFCSDGNMGIITTVYYTMENGKVVQEDVMEEDYNSAPAGGDPQTRSLTDDAELYSMLQTEIPVTLQMFTPDEIRSIGWKELISRYPFVAADSSEDTSSSGPTPASGQTGTAPASGQTGAAPAGYSAPFYGVWCSASKSYADMQAAAGQLSQYGLPSGIFVTTDWSNLNPEFWYVLSAGTYSSESAAYAALLQVQNVFPDAYVKYSGDYIGG